MHKPLFTIIICSYNRPAFLKHAVEAIFRQTYPHLEIILINNGSTIKTVDEYLNHIAKQDRRIKIINFSENQYSINDPVKYLDICLNAGLKIATGDYIFHQSDDDWIADDYVEKMVALFKGNPDCTSAAGLYVAVDINGNVISSEVRTKNFRPRYMPGHLMALDHLRGGSMFSAPGTIFTFKRDVLVKAGGYHRYIEPSQLYGIVPFGITGFDETAVLYWRRHEGQLNKLISTDGYTCVKEFFSFLREWEIERRWQVFGSEIAREVVTALKIEFYSSAADWFTINIARGNIVACRRIIQQIGHHPEFWRQVPRALGQVVWGYSRGYLKGPVRTIFRLCPWLAALSPRLAALRARAERVK